MSQSATGRKGVLAASAGRLRAWQWIHRWSSLLCTAFLLVICVTGLPLVFHEEIDHWLHPTSYARAAPNAPRADLDRLAARSRAIYPGQILIGMFVDDDEPQVIIYLAPSWAELQAHPSSRRFIRFDSHTGVVLEQSRPAGQDGIRFLPLTLRLHMDLFAGLPGELFMGAMALLFVIAIVSGVVLYGPFTRKLDFGSVRSYRSGRVRWLDLHNLLGVVTLAWALVVGTTGVMNELSTPLFALWQNNDVAAMTATWRGETPPVQNELSSVQAALETVERALPGMIVTSVTYPGGPLGSPHHYLLFTKGKTPLTRRLFSPVLIDARTGKLTAVVPMPWYLRALEVSRPLHFGDYGGLPLKILWALLDLVTIVVLGSGLYLWIARPRRERAAARCETLHGASPVMEPAE